MHISMYVLGILLYVVVVHTDIVKKFRFFWDTVYEKLIGS